jgi:exopolyphosphatase/guanosine-5'-triphosphate,3'-diphosphate pyrophosphatase
VIVEVLSGEDEARLTYDGARSELFPDAGRIAVVDIGGGSVEIALGDARGCHDVHSLPLGVLRLRGAFVGADGQLSERIADRVRDRVRAAAAPAAAAARVFRPELVVFTSGTAKAVAALSQRLHADEVPDRELHIDAVERSVTLLTKLKPAAISLLGIEEGRTDTIAVGAVVVETLLELFETGRARVSGRALREGVALREARRMRPVFERPATSLPAEA